MARLDPEILKQIDDEEEFDRMESWADAVEEGFKEDPERQELYKYVKKRISAISGYSTEFFQEKALEKLINQLFKKAGCKKIEDINDNLIKDLIIEIVTTPAENLDYSILNDNHKTPRR